MRKELFIFCIVISDLSKDKLIDLFGSIETYNNFNEKATKCLTSQTEGEKDLLNEALNYIKEMKDELNFFLDKETKT